MVNKFRKFVYSYYWIISVVIFLYLVIFASLGKLSNDYDSVWSTLIAAGLGWTYFFQKQKLEEDKYFLESFARFNERFYKLSDELHAAIDNDNSQQNDILKPGIHKYFDLCLEEYQLYKMGRIPEPTWLYWVKGMHYYLQFSPVKKYWLKIEAEKLDDGLTIAFLEKCLGKPIDSSSVD